MWQPQSKDTFQYDTGTYDHQAVLHNLKTATGLTGAALARPVGLSFAQSHSLLSSQPVQFSLLPHVFHIPQGPYYLAQKLVPTDVPACLHVVAEICTPRKSASSSGLKSPLQAIGCQHLGKCAELAAHGVPWAREHLAGITMFSLAPWAAKWAVAAMTMSCGDDSCLAHSDGLMEHGIWEGVKYLYHKLNHFAVWTFASFYNNFHLKLAQYIFNEFVYKAFNSPQFISSGKWLSSLELWAGFWLYIHYLRRNSDFLLCFVLIVSPRQGLFLIVLSIQYKNTSICRSSFSLGWD